jgi:hypothetical protein
VPLRSQMLREDRALQACLVSDPAHVVPGSRGPHVAKIQSALLLLDRRLTLPAVELRAKHYGPGTAAAVLEFKRKRRIINFSYQTAPDNIVGKMTIARLDDELFGLEIHPNPGRVVCSGSSAPIVTSDQSSEPFLLVGAPGRDAPNKPPARTFQSARVSVLFQETDAAVEAGGGVSLLFGLFQKARVLMAPFGLDFAGADAGGIFPLIGPRIPDSEQVIGGSPASTFSVRAAAERVFPGQPTVLRVIFCPFAVKDDRTFGITDGGQVGDWNFPKFCLINVRKANPDQGTLLHEIIHASRPEKRDHDQDPLSVFSENIGGRARLPVDHAEAMAHAFFSVVLGVR